jgi:hypothetical protein
MRIGFFVSSRKSFTFSIGNGRKTRPSATNLRAEIEAVFPLFELPTPPAHHSLQARQDWFIQSGVLQRFRAAEEYSPVAPNGRGSESSSAPSEIRVRCAMDSTSCRGSTGFVRCI